MGQWSIHWGLGASADMQCPLSPSPLGPWLPALYFPGPGTTLPSPPHSSPKTTVTLSLAQQQGPLSRGSSLHSLVPSCPWQCPWCRCRWGRVRYLAYGISRGSTPAPLAGDSEGASGTFSIQVLNVYWRGSYNTLGVVCPL